MSETVKRWTPADSSINGHSYMREVDDLENCREHFTSTGMSVYVKASDYASLQKRVEEADRELAKAWNKSFHLSQSNMRLNAEVIALRAEAERLKAESVREYLARQIEWSTRTFGGGKRTGGITKHIQKECAEVCASPNDLLEWVDIIILAMDGFWRAGGTPEQVMEKLNEKQRVNFTRSYPMPTSEDELSEHYRASRTEKGTP